MNADDETSITELEILADGRIYVFGASKEIYQLLAELQPKIDNPSEVCAIQTQSTNIGNPSEQSN